MALPINVEKLLKGNIVEWERLEKIGKRETVLPVTP